MSDSHVHLTRVAAAAARWRLALMLTIAMMVVYFGFILLVAFNKPLLGTILVPGLSLGILLGALVIVTGVGADLASTCAGPTRTTTPRVRTSGAR